MLILYHDYTSPASAVAVMRLDRLMREGLPAQIRGTDVTGIDATLPVTVDLLAALEAIEDEAAAEGIVLRRPKLVPPTALAHVVEDVAREHGMELDWREVCYRAYWSEGRNIGDSNELRRLAARAGLPPERADSALDDRIALAAVRRRSARDRRNGIGGAPTILYDRTLVPGLLPEDDLRVLARLGSEAS